MRVPLLASPPPTPPLARVSSARRPQHPRPSARMPQLPALSLSISRLSQSHSRVRRARETCGPCTPGMISAAATSLDRHTTGAPRTQQLEPRLDVSHWPGGGQTEAARRTRHGKPWTSHHCHQPQNGEARDRRLPAPRTATHFILSCGRLPSRTGAQLSKRPSYICHLAVFPLSSFSLLPAGGCRFILADSSLSSASFLHSATAPLQPGR